MATEIAGFNEASATELFASQSHFMLACQFASLVIDTFLAGILTMQIFNYFTYQSKDRLWTRLVVIWVSIMNLVVTTYYWAYISYLFVDSYGKWLPWLEVRWLMLMPIFDVMCVSVVQGFFAHRAFVLNKRSWPLLVLAGCLILVATGGAIGVTIVFGSQDSLLGASACGPTLITWNTATAACDVLIAGSILYALLRSKSGWAHTDRLISRLIRLTFEAQLPPTFLAIAYIVEWSVQPSSLLGAVFQAIQCKAYTVGLLFSLNARIAFTTHPVVTTGNEPQVYGMSARSHRSARHLTGQVQVDVETETYVTESPYENIDLKQGAASDNELGLTVGDKEAYLNNSSSHLTQEAPHHVLT